MEYWEGQKEPLCPGFDSVAKKEIYCEKKLLANFFDRVQTWTYLKKERKRTEEKPYSQTEKEGFEKILLLKSQTQVKTLYYSFLVAL